MTGIKIVDNIMPDFPTDKEVHTSPNSERWFKIIGDVLYIPSENVLRGNFVLIDKLIEALHNFAQGGPSVGWWDDTKVNGKLYSTKEDCINAIDFLGGFDTLAVDIETRNTGYSKNKLLLVGFAYGDYDSIAINCFEPEVIQALKDLFSRTDITFVWQNGKFDTARMKFLCGIDARIDEDTMLQHYAGINERKGTHGLKDLGELYLGAPKWDDQLKDYIRRWCLQHKVKVADFQYDMIPFDILVPYLYRDTCATFQLNKLFKTLMRPGSERVYASLIKAANVFKEIECNGCLVDIDYIYQLQDDLDTKILEADRRVQEVSKTLWNPFEYMEDTGAKSFPGKFNLKSPKQLKWMLERATGDKIEKTDKETLDNLIEEYPEIPFIQAICDLRKFNKYMDTYVQGILDVMDSDNRVRCTFNLHGTETGRLSCSDPKTCWGFVA